MTWPEIAANPVPQADLRRRSEAELTAPRSLSASNSPGKAPPPAERWLVWLAPLVVIVSLAGPLDASGIWDPHELRIAEIGRRIALNMLGGQDLALQGADNRIPIASELGRGELPFTSIAIAFRLFGLAPWAGRLAMLFWALVGVSATYVLIARLSGRTAALFSAIVLGTTPLYFVQARTMLGDITDMASLALAVAGLGLSVFDSERRFRAVWLVMGVIGLSCGFLSRGLLIGVALPACAVGASWLTAVSREQAARGPKANTFAGIASSMIGCAALVWGGHEFWTRLELGGYSKLMGVAIEKANELKTFDHVVQVLGHGLYPYSAVIPLALGLLMRPAPECTGNGRQLGLRLLLVHTALLGFLFYTLLAPHTALLSFGPVFALAGILGVVFCDFERSRLPCRWFAVLGTALLVLLFYDLQSFPEKAFSAWSIDQASFPQEFPARSKLVLLLASVLCMLVFFFAFIEDHNKPAPRLRLDRYVHYFRVLQRNESGFWFGFWLFEATLCGVAVMLWLSDRFFHIAQFEALSTLARRTIEYGWLLVLSAGLCVVPGIWLVRDLFARWFGVCADRIDEQDRHASCVKKSHRAVMQLRPSHAAGSALAFAGLGLCLSLSFHPALAAQLSPRDLFDVYKRVAKAGQPLATLGMSGSGASYYTGSSIPEFDEVAPALSWLTKDRSRRFLLARTEDLPILNSLYRRQTSPSRNLPVLDGGLTDLFLVSNRPEPSENHNPLNELVLSDRPRPKRPLDVTLESELRVIGWEVLEEGGRPAELIAVGKPYEFVIYYEVLGEMSAGWKTFIHIDGFQRRFNGDHETLGGKYPFHLWQPGDFIRDAHRFRLEPNFTPGTYSVYFGLFEGKRRLEVSRGAHDDDRIIAGKVTVR